MQFHYFTERPYRGLTEEQILDNGGFYALPNSNFDRHTAARDYNYYLDEYVYAEELGFDGLALNEHHGTPFCMGSIVDTEAAILARITSKAKIVLIGNALPNPHPLRLAEELATIDLISRGRLVAGWVRGAPSNQFFNNMNPAYNREYFEEAHDVIIKTWTTPGPWRYEGKHFHYRQVNPWTLPYQQPHPPIWIPGVLSPETIVFSAERSYPYISLGATPATTCDMWDIYADAAEKQGLQAGPENFGIFMQTIMADSDAEAQEIGRSFFFAGGHSMFARPEHMAPAGYLSEGGVKAMAKVPTKSWVEVARRGEEEPSIEQQRARRRERSEVAYMTAQQNCKMLIGTPESVLERAKLMLEILRPGSLFFSAPQGNTSNDVRRRNMEYLAQDLIPELRAHADKLGLVDAFQRQPGSVKIKGSKRAEVVDRARLGELGF